MRAALLCVAAAIAIAVGAAAAAADVAAAGPGPGSAAVRGYAGYDVRARVAEGPFELMEGEAPSFLDLSAVERDGHMCAKGFYCPVDGGVCCRGGRVCCESACNNDNDPPTCELSKTAKALALAKAKMEQEAQQEVQTKVSQLSDGEAGLKATEEAREKDVNEQKSKEERTKQEAKEKSSRANAEADEKDRNAKQEQESKHVEDTSAKEKNEQLKTSEQQNKQKVLVELNLSLKKGNQILGDADLVKGDSYTYMFWIFPLGTNPAWTSIVHKGAVDGERNPAIFFIPGTTRLHCRSGTQAVPNDGVDTTQALPLNTWSHVTLSHTKGLLQVAINGQVVVEKKGIDAPRINKGPVYASDPWYDAGKAIIADLRYQASVATDAQVKKALDSKAYAPVQLMNPPLKASNYVPRKNQVLATADKISYDSEYSVMFWVQPRGIIEGWGSILHKGAADTQRNPGCWFYPGSTRLACRSGVGNDWNYGNDPNDKLVMFKWTHVAMVHKAGSWAIFYDGQQVMNIPNAPGPTKNAGPLYSGDPWYEAHPSQMSDVRVENKYFTAEMIKAVIAAKGYQDEPPRPALVLQSGQFALQQNKIIRFAAELEPFRSLAHTWSIFIKPVGINGGWSNVFHKGLDDSWRAPAMWMYPGSTRVHYRARTSRGWNDGGDAERVLPMGQWTHFAAVHFTGVLRIYHDGQLVYEENGMPTPDWQLHNMYASNPWYPPASVQVAEFRYYNVALSPEDLKSIKDEGRPK